MKFLAALPPFYDARGIKRASYQIVAADGFAIATCNVANGRVELTIAMPEVDCEQFEAEALAHFNATAGRRYAPAIARDAIPEIAEIF